MNFTKLHRDTVCNCMEDTKEDFVSEFGIKADKKDLRLVDFKSKWERNQRPEPGKENDCYTITLLKGKSMSIITNKNLNEVKALYSTMGNLAPKYKRFMILFKLKNNSGVVRKTVARANPHHYTFFKCDEFELSNVTQTKSISL